MRKAWLFLLIPLFLVLTINPVFAEDVDLINVPQKVGESLGIPEPYTAEIGGLLMTMIVFLAFVMPTLLLRNKAPALIMTFMVLGFTVAVGWLQGWIMLMSVLIVAGIMANKLRRIFT